MDDSSAVLQAVKQFATELANLRHEERDERDKLIKDVKAETVALRHDMYGSILLLDQRLTEQDKESDEWRKDVIQNRERESAERKAGQKLTRALLATLVVMVFLLSAGVVALVVKVFA